MAAAAAEAGLTFSPQTVSVNVAQGATSTVTVRATLLDTSQLGSTLYIQVVDDGQVLAGIPQLSIVDEKTVAAVLHISPALAPGRHQGSLLVKLCKDAGCASQLPGSPAALPYAVTVSATPLRVSATGIPTATVHQGGAVASKVTVSVAGPKGTWSAASDVDWLVLSGATGKGAGSFTVGYATAAVAEGEHVGTVTVTSADGQSERLPFSLKVLPTSFIVSQGSAKFAAVNGAPIPARSLTLNLNNGIASAWSALASAPWLSATPASGTTPATVTLHADPAQGSLASGKHKASLVLSSPGVADKTVPVQLVLSKPKLSSNPATLTFGGPKGRGLAGSQSVQFALNTGANAWPYTVSGLPDWLSVSAPSGTVRGAGSSLAFSPVLANVPVGSKSGTVRINATVNGDTVSLPVSVNVNADQHRLLPSHHAVALSSTPKASRLSQRIDIQDNFGIKGEWTAVSDAAWLSVTGSGATGGELVVEANPASLPAEQLSYANVTVASTAAGVGPAVIRVALWKSGKVAPETTRLAQRYANIVADRLRPYVYVNNGGTGIDVYNAYTAQKVATIAKAGSALGQMSVSMDGSRLYALDTANRRMAVVDLTAMQKVGGWALDKAVNASTAVLAIRPNGVEVVLVGDGTAYTPSGRSLGSTGIWGPMSANSSGTIVVTLGARHAVDYSAMSGGVLFPQLLNYLDTQTRGNLTDIAISPNGSRVYQASGGGVQDAGYKCGAMAAGGSFIGALPGGEAYPNNVEVTVNGQAICGISGWYAKYDFWVHSYSGALLRGYKVAGYANEIMTRALVVTPDGKVVVALTDDPVIAFVPLGL